MENTTEKKLYPSQINSKTISARIPVNDYVNFLQESLKNGISLNDWLLIKIYSNQADNIGNIKSEKSEKDDTSFIRIYKEDLLVDDNEFIDATKQWLLSSDLFKNGYFDFDKETLLELIKQFCCIWIENRGFWKQLNTKKEASLVDVKTQLTFLINDKFTNINDRKEYRKDLFELLHELD